MGVNRSAHDRPRTLTDYLRTNYQHLLDPPAAFLNRLGIAPNTVTLLGLAGNLVGALLLAQGRFQVGGLLVVLMGPIDALDGAMARLRGEPSEFGAFVDSVTDRYSELTIYAGLLYYALHSQETSLAGMIFAAAAGSVLVSYVRARGEALGYQVRGGVLTRVERYLVLAPSLVLRYPIIGVGIVALLANLTALQRVLIVRRQVHTQPIKGKTNVD